MRRIITAFRRRAADGNQRGRFPAVAAENRHRQSELPRLQNNQPDFRVIAGHKNAVGILRLDGGQLRVEILVTAAVILFRRDFSAAAGKAVLEKFRQAEAVIAFHVRQHRDGIQLERLAREIRHDRALERINEAHAENVIAGFGDLGIGGRGRNHRNPVLLADRRGFERARRRDFAEHRHDAVAGNQLAHHRRRLAGLRLVVLGEQLNFFAEHAARRVEVVNRQRRAFVRRLPEGRLAAGQRRELADFDGVAARAGRRRLIATGEQN